MTPRRATRLEVPPPGPRCPACWHPAAGPLRPGTVIVCSVCFVLVLVPPQGPVMRIDPALHFWMLTGPVINELARLQSDLILSAAARWRTLPRPPRVPTLVRIWR